MYVWQLMHRQTYHKLLKLVLFAIKCLLKVDNPSHELILFVSYLLQLGLKFTLLLLVCVYMCVYMYVYVHVLCVYVCIHVSIYACSLDVFSSPVRERVCMFMFMHIFILYR
jgi:hypothetical protein